MDAASYALDSHAPGYAAPSWPSAAPAEPAATSGAVPTLGLARCTAAPSTLPPLLPSAGGAPSEGPLASGLHHDREEVLDVVKHVVW